MELFYLLLVRIKAAINADLPAIIIQGKSAHQRLVIHPVQIIYTKKLTAPNNKYTHI